MPYRGQVTIFGIFTHSHNCKNTQAQGTVNSGVYLTNMGQKEFLRLQIAGNLTPDSVHSIQKSKTKAHSSIMVLPCQPASSLWHQQSSAPGSKFLQFDVLTGRAAEMLLLQPTASLKVRRGSSRCWTRWQQRHQHREALLDN